MIIYGALLISEEKELNSLNKCDKFFVGFIVKHDSFESLLQQNLSLRKE